jgi:hypothetical protein
MERFLNRRILMNMKKCDECGKELSFLGGYYHPIMGRDHLLCAQCFDIVEKSVIRWYKAVVPYTDYFNTKSSNPTLDKHHSINEVPSEKRRMKKELPK